MTQSLPGDPQQWPSGYFFTQTPFPGYNLTIYTLVYPQAATLKVLLQAHPAPGCTRQCQVLGQPSGTPKQKAPE